jgi:hypothetical protein
MLLLFQLSARPLKEFFPTAGNFIGPKKTNFSPHVVAKVIFIYAKLIVAGRSVI